MTRAFDFTLSGVIIIISIIIHRISLELFNQNTALYAVATDGTEVLNGAQRAALWSDILIIWMPLAGVGFALVYALIKEYRRQVQTGIQSAQRRP